MSEQGSSCRKGFWRCSYAALAVGLALAVAGNGPAFAGPAENGAKSAAQAPISVGAGWESFYFDGVGSVSGPFDYSNPVGTAVWVTDDFCKGDQFEVFDNGVSLGVTNPVAVGPCEDEEEVGPDAAFADPTYSSGCFNVRQGAHSITIEAIASPFGGGGAYIQVLEGRCPLELTKEIVSGNDMDDDGEIDKVVEVGIEHQSMYDFKITWTGPAGGDPVVILDTAPAEWDVTVLDEAATPNFDFEEFAESGGGAYVELFMTRGSQSVTLYRLSGTAFDIVDLSLDADPSWGTSSLLPSFPGPAGDFWIADLSLSAENVCLDFSDYGADDDTPVLLLAFDGPGASGTIVDFDFDTWLATDSLPSFKTNCVSASGFGNIQSIAFTSNGPFPNSLYWDNTQVEFDTNTLNCEVAGANKKGNSKSATKITCYPGTDAGMATFWATARCHDKPNNQKCRPTSCGALYLNEGAGAYLLDGNDEPIYPPIAESNSLCLAAVEDLDGEGLVYDGTGDEDDDGALDYAEACEYGTDPCDADTDGDGVSDGREIATGCMDPLDPDTDDDGFDDGEDACPCLGDEGLGVDETGCPVRSCEMDAAGFGTFHFLLEGDGTLLPGSYLAAAGPGTDWPAEGFVNPDGAAQFSIVNPTPDGCTAWVDFAGLVANCTGGASCAGVYATFCVGGGGVPEDSGPWSGTFTSTCEVSNPDAASGPLFAPVSPAVPDGDPLQVK